MIPFNKPISPDEKVFSGYIQQILDSQIYTNQGPLVTLLEERMAEYLGVENISFVSSGTMGLQLAIKSLDKKGEIITTPFSYAATVNAIIWEGHKPVFADILKDKLTIDPVKVEAQIGPDTIAILATHVYGNPCDTEALEQLAKKHNLVLIYDGAHTFGSRHLGKSLLSYGDFSVLSTHATKMFHTANGGFVISKTKEAKEKIDRLKNFGHQGQNNFVEAGINGKNSEIHAAIGLSLLDEAEEIVMRRKDQWSEYAESLEHTNFTLLRIENAEGFNGAYFPVICQNTDVLERILELGKAAQIEFRRYFYPALHELSFTPDAVNPIAKDIAERVLCLPMFHDMKTEEQEQVVACLKSAKISL